MLRFESVSANEIAQVAEFLTIRQSSAWEGVLDRRLTAWRLVREQMTPRRSSVLNAARDASERWTRPIYEELLSSFSGHYGIARRNGGRSSTNVGVGKDSAIITEG